MQFPDKLRLLKSDKHIIGSRSCFREQKEDYGEKVSPKRYQTNDFKSR